MQKQCTVPEMTPRLSTILKSLKERGHILADYTHVDRFLLASNYLVEQLHKRPHFADLLNQLDQPVSSQLCYQRLAEYSARQPFALALRLFRHEMMFRIITRMVSRNANTSVTLTEISNLALCSIRCALKEVHQQMSSRYGQPLSRAGEQQQLLVIAMGKLGGMELNLSSDIDLIFAYSEDGVTSTQKLDNRTFFTRAGRELIRLLDEQTTEGFVFRVDMRLRPYGSAGNLVASFADLEKYYVEQAREWERFALARAKVITGTSAMQHKLTSLINSFVYRKYVDFSVLKDLRTIKQAIRQETLRSNRHDDIKLGAGGIREIEFIAHTYQLVYGGTQLVMRRQSTMQVLAIMEKLGYFDKSDIAQLQTAYLFLRNLENHLQCVDDLQTHCLPSDQNTCERLAYVLGYHQYSYLVEHWKKTSATVQSIFDNLLPADTSVASIDSQWQLAANQVLAGKKRSEADFIADTQTTLDKLISKIQQSTELVRNLCGDMMPYLLHAAHSTQNPAQAIERLCRLLESILRRSAYISMLNENRHILPDMAKLIVASDWVYTWLCRSPAQIHSFLHVHSLALQPDKMRLSDELRNQISDLPEHDDEQQIHALRHFANALVFQTAIAQLSDRLPITRISDRLTYTAEVCIEHALHIAWNHLSANHGSVQGDSQATGFAVIAYGKLGGLELNYTSDLDLVFVFSGNANTLTGGKKPIPLLQLYTRLAQRIIHILTTPTPVGDGYKLDARLRPQGSKGLLVNSMTALEDYLHNHAWTWEHQALLRARPIAGDRSTMQQFNAVRAKILCRQRDNAKLKKAVLRMRRRIGEIKQDQDIKFAAGGLVDIEFMVQYLGLAHAAQFPDIIHYSDNLRQIEALVANGVLTSRQQQILIDAYLSLRAITHFKALAFAQPVDIDSHTSQVQQVQQEIYCD